VVSKANAAITVIGANDNPIAIDDVQSSIENAPALTIDVLANDTDADSSDTHTLSNLQFSAGQGSASIADNKLVWDQGSDFDQLAVGETVAVIGSYTINDNHGSATQGQVTILVTGENDAPLAVHDAGFTDAGTAVTLHVLANDSDLDDSDVLTLTSASSTGGGSVSIVSDALVFDPDGQFDHLTRGQLEDVTLVYSISDGNGGIDTNTATVTVEGDNTIPLAVNDKVTVGEDVNRVVIDVLANDTDPDVNELLNIKSANITSGDGSVLSEDNNVVWESGGEYQYLAEGESASVTLAYTMEDSFGASDTASVALVVEGSNDAPVLLAASSGGSITEQFEVKDSTFSHELTSTFQFSDIDLTDAHTITVTAAGSGYLGSLAATKVSDSTEGGNGEVRWDFAVQDQQLDSMRDGQIKEQTYTVTVEDGNGGEASHAVTVTLNGNFDVGDLDDGNDNPPVAVDDVLFAVNYDTTGYSFNQTNGHYYKFVAGNYDWFQAQTAADAAGGYLATVTTEQENTFVAGISNGTTWLGARDSAAEGEWQWVTGPEAGTAFWSGDTTGSTVSGGYQNWVTAQQTSTVYSEPNNVNNNENYAEILGSSDTWNDQPNAGFPGAGYIVELDGPVYDWHWTDKTVDAFDLDFTWTYDTHRYTPSGWSYNPDNGHYYKFVSGSFSWSDALTTAGSTTVSTMAQGEGHIGAWPLNIPFSSPSDARFSVSGHLVTITSEQENTFVADLIGNARAWIGASDAGTEGTWKWVTGPENGTTFW
ncbi:MAG: Ig-like domain-containing protein, partial [Pseudohongiellaceae bacterium]